MLEQLPHRLRFIVRHPFARHSAILQVAAVIGRAVGLIAGIIYANLLGPENFGRYALVIALGGFLNVFQEFGIGHAMINLLSRAEARSERDEAKFLLAYFLKASIAIAVTTGLSGMLIAPWLGTRWYQDSEIGWLASVTVLIFALTFFMPLVTTLQQIRRELVPLALLETGSKIFGAALTVILLLVGGGVAAVIGSQFIVMVVFSIIAAALYQKYVRQNTAWGIFSLWRTKIPWSRISYYFRFGFLIAISKNILKINQTVPLLILGAVLPTASGLGFYKVAFTYVGLPLVLADPIARLLNDQFPKTEVAGTDKLFKRFFQVTGLTVAMIAAVLTPALLLAPWGMSVLFPKYGPALPFVFILAPYPLLVAAGTGLGAMFRTLNRMRVNVAIQAITLVTLLPTAWWLIPRLAIKGLIAVILIFTLLPNALGLGYFAWLRRRLSAII